MGEEINCGLRPSKEISNIETHEAKTRYQSKGIKNKIFKACTWRHGGHISGKNNSEKVFLEFEILNSVKNLSTAAFHQSLGQQLRFRSPFRWPKTSGKLWAHTKQVDKIWKISLHPLSTSEVKSALRERQYGFTIERYLACQDSLICLDKTTHPLRSLFSRWFRASHFNSSFQRRGESLGRQVWLRERLPQICGTI